MVQIEMNKPSACRWTDEEGSIHLCPFLDSEYECILQGRIGYWSWGGQYKNCPLHEVTEDSDTISREAVINAINSLHDKPNAWLDCAVEAVESLPSSPTPNRPHGRWIPCSERLPEDNTEVFVYLFDHHSPYIAWVVDSRWYTEEFEIEIENEPIAWMPLPKPYRKDGAANADVES